MCRIRREGVAPSLRSDRSSQTTSGRGFVARASTSCKWPFLTDSNGVGHGRNGLEPVGQGMDHDNFILSLFACSQAGPGQRSGVLDTQAGSGCPIQVVRTGAHAACPVPVAFNNSHACAKMSHHCGEELFPRYRAALSCCQLSDNLEPQDPAGKSGQKVKSRIAAILGPKRGVGSGNNAQARICWRAMHGLHQ